MSMDPFEELPPQKKLATGFLIMPAGPCTVEKLKWLWMNTNFANATEKYDHELSFDQLIADLQARKLKTHAYAAREEIRQDHDRSRFHMDCIPGECLVHGADGPCPVGAG